MNCEICGTPKKPLFTTEYCPRESEHKEQFEFAVTREQVYKKGQLSFIRARYHGEQAYKYTLRAVWNSFEAFMAHYTNNSGDFDGRYVARFHRQPCPHEDVYADAFGRPMMWCCWCGDQT